MKRYIIIILFIILALTLNNCNDVSKQPAVRTVNGYDYSHSGAIDNFSRLIRFRTVLDQNAVFDERELRKAHDHLRTAYPLSHRTMKLTIINKYSLLYRWEGKDKTLDPLMILAHLDVVPAGNPGSWKHPPFSGRVEKGFIWGRGTIDTKFMLSSIMEAAEYLVKKGFQPKRTIYFSFGHDEELMGTRGNRKTAEYLAKQNVKLAYVLDEGMPIMYNKIKGLDKPVAFIGTAAKGHFYMKLTARGEGGHGSIPKGTNAISRLSKAIVNLYEYQFEDILTKPLEDTFLYLAPEVKGFNRLVFSHPRLFSSFITGEIAKEPAGKAMVSTTISVNLIKGGEKDATAPTDARAVIAVGFLPGETIESMHNKIISIIDDREISTEFVVFPDNGTEHKYNPTLAAPSDNRAFDRLKTTICEIFPDTVVAPTLFVGGSDGKHFINAGLTDKVYNFWPVILNDELIETIHGTDERMPVEGFYKSIDFFIRFFQNAD